MVMLPLVEEEPPPLLKELRPPVAPHFTMQPLQLLIKLWFRRQNFSASFRVQG